MAVSKLPPIDFTEDNEKYEAHHDQMKTPVDPKKESNFPKCSHAQARIIGQELRCPCGVAFSGQNLHVLEKLLTKTD